MSTHSRSPFKVKRNKPVTNLDRLKGPSAKTEEELKREIRKLEKKRVEILELYEALYEEEKVQDAYLTAKMRRILN